ncbi:SRPBCC family protein [Nocardia farcinica]|uniref:Polyketide cyclase / dehydrase and lipid transport n=2 Tax=Nocardia farcinica TaxID=37329 RepID=Q5YY96_NOCFA|nr:SRPBCC family protein [Nocardia farcinica]AXK85420.1 SRPBCC family protein [Nocardia farcinica]MBA4859638.1 SRPBCC family protein [Nocardia farcinica]MBC9819614.1 SRPBCC family protein [Nocardia farcinica]MBF6072640.1 SRPBCC family protein [Nocardia farcinica]MBF6143510.1 SRPBCC family protein [Nocardia farcinica]
MPRSTVEAVIPAPRQAVYTFFVNRDGINPFLPGVQFTLKKPGTDSPSGVGAQYTVGRGSIGFVEETTTLVPNERFEYKIVKGVPVKRHVGIVTFADAEGGTRVTYTMESEPSLPVPAKVLEAGLRTLIGQIMGATKKAFA